MLAYGQNKANIKGEYILQVQTDRDAACLQKYSQAYARAGKAIQFKKLSSQPFNIWLVISTEDEYTNQSLFNFLQASTKVVHVAPNRRIVNRKTPNDPFIAQQWQYNNNGSNNGVVNADIDLLKAWDITTGGKNSRNDKIVACIIDDGINLNHEDITGNLWHNTQEIPSNGIDDDLNGYIDDVRGWNAKNQNDDIGQGGSHGTPVAGIIGAKGNNNIGVSGVNWDIGLMIVDYNSPSEAYAIAAYSYPYTMRKLYNQTNGQKGAFVVVTNSSWGIDNASAESAPLWCAMYDSLGSVGILSVGATANNDTNVDIDGDLPTSCSSEYLLTVTNINRRNVKVSEAGYGYKSIDLGSYGESAYTVSFNNYGSFGGTSAATPHVAGLIGLLYSGQCKRFDSISLHNPSEAALIVRDMVLNNTKPNASINQITSTGGVLNARQSIESMLSFCSECHEPVGVSFTPSEDKLYIQYPNADETFKVSVRYRKENQSNWSVINEFNAGQSINDLSYCTTYEIQIGYACDTSQVTYGYSRFIKSDGCCTKPENIEQTATDNSLQIKWDSTSNAIYNITLTSIDSTSIEILTANNYLFLDSLYACQGYLVSISANCPEYGTSSDGGTNFLASTECGSCTSNDYCDFSKKDNSQEWIEKVEIGNWTNTSGQNENGFIDFKGFTTPIFYKNTEYNFTIHFAYASNTFPEYSKMYLDANQDGIFDESESLYIASSPSTHNAQGKILIPNSSTTGPTKLRVIMSYEQFEGSCDNTEFEYGEIEDYCVNIDTSRCNSNAPIIVTNITQESFVLKSVSDTLETQNIEVYIRKKDTEDWQVLTFVDSLLFDRAEECTVYEYKSRLICNAHDFGEFSPIDSLKTSCKNNTNDPNTINELIIYPNPTTNILYLKNSLGSHFDNVAIQIRDSRGVLMPSPTTINVHNIITVDLSNLINGIYTLIITRNNEVPVYRKVLKM